MLSSHYLKLLDFQIFAAIIFVVCAWKWGDWKNWQVYYPTILYFALGDCIYFMLTYNFPLWEYESPLLRTTLSDLLIALVVFPSTILLYLGNFPQVLWKKVLHIVLWSLIYVFIELVAFELGFFSHHNGWNIWWSLAFNLVMFPMLWYHHKRPLHALLLSLPIAIGLYLYFGIPFSSMK